MLKAFLSLSARNLWVHKRRNFITAIGIAIAFCGVILLGGYMLRMEGYLATHTIFFRQVGHVSIWKKDGPAKIFHKPRAVTLTLDDQSTILRWLKPMLTPRDLIVPVLKGQGLITNGCSSFPVLLTALAPEHYQFIYSHPTVKEKLPELLRLEQGVRLWEAPAADGPIMISRTLQGFLGKTTLLDPNQPSANAGSLLTNCSSVTSREASRRDPFVQIFSQSFDGGLGIVDAAPVGLVQTGFVFSDETSVQMSLAAAQRLFATDNVTYFAVYLDDPSRRSAVIKNLRKDLDLSKFEVHSYTDESVSELYVGAMNFVYMMLMFFAVLICGVVILAVVSSFNIAFMERRPEIATLRSIGLRPFLISRLLAVEYLVLTTLSLLGGGVLAFAIKSLNNALNVRFRIPGYSNDLQFVLQPNFIFTSITVIAFLLLVCATSFVLAHRLNQKKIVDLMRVES